MCQLSYASVKNSFFPLKANIKRASATVNSANFSLNRGWDLLYRIETQLRPSCEVQPTAHSSWSCLPQALHLWAFRDNSRDMPVGMGYGVTCGYKPRLCVLVAREPQARRVPSLCLCLLTYKMGMTARPTSQCWDKQSHTVKVPMCPFRFFPIRAKLRFCK